MDIANKRLSRIRYFPEMANAKPKAIEPSPLEDRTPGELLREARVRHELSQKQLAVRAGTTQSAIARIERDRTSPSIKTLTALFQAMEEDFVFGSRPRDWGVDLSLNHKNLEFTPTERLERGLGFSEVIREVQGQIADRRALDQG
jgi:transcriptional regulator with XRE-family HTH domain